MVLRAVGRPGEAGLLVWPVKWQQYLMLILVPLAICAAHAPAAIAALTRRFRGGSGTPVPETPPAPG